jgi:Spy/CpxP family protein refolding chaperone
MIVKEVALIVTVLTLGIGGTMALADSVKESPSSVLISETKIMAQQERGKPRGKERAEQLQERLNLSNPQMEQLSSIRQKYRSQMEQVREKMKAKGQELSQMIQGNASENDLRNKHQEMSVLRREMEDLRFESMLEVRKVLTPEQRQQFAQLMEERGQRRGGNGSTRRETP